MEETYALTSYGDDISESMRIANNATKKILMFIRENKSATQEDLSSIFGRNETNKAIKELQNKKMIFNMEQGYKGPTRNPVVNRIPYVSPPANKVVFSAVTSSLNAPSRGLSNSIEGKRNVSNNNSPRQLMKGNIVYSLDEKSQKVLDSINSNNTNMYSIARSQNMSTSDVMNSMDKLKRLGRINLDDKTMRTMKSTSYKTSEDVPGRSINIYDSRSYGTNKNKLDFFKFSNCSNNACSPNGTDEFTGKYVYLVPGGDAGNIDATSESYVFYGKKNGENKTFIVASPGTLIKGVPIESLVKKSSYVFNPDDIRNLNSSTDVKKPYAQRLSEGFSGDSLLPNRMNANMNADIKNY